MPEISIIVPLYNKRKYVTAMLESIRRQTFQEYELILVDDGSTDGSGQIAEEYANHDRRVHVVHIKNGGVSHARNVGLETATGMYITFIDADDTVVPNYLENLYRCITENDVDLVISGVTKTNCEDGRNHVIIAPYSGVKSIDVILRDFVRVQKSTGIYGTCVAKLFHRSLCESARFDENLELAEDYDFYIKLFKEIRTVYFDNHSLYYYLQDADNSSVRVKDDEIDYLGQVMIQLRVEDFLRKNSAYYGENRELTEKSLSNYFYNALRYSRGEKAHVVFNELYLYFKNGDVKLKGSGIRQKLLLTLFKHRKEKTIHFFTSAWHFARRVLRKG